MKRRICGTQKGVRSVLVFLAVSVVSFASVAAPLSNTVPGVVVDYSPQSSGIFIGSPSLAVLTNGDYVASHDEFGPRSAEHVRAVSQIFRSQDRGASWRKVSTI